jgi:hypothetical protein
VARRDLHPTQFLAGQTLALPISPETYELSAVFKSPAYPDEPAFESSARAADAAPGEAVVLRGPRAARLGTYKVELSPRGGGGGESRPLCANLDPAESDLAVAAPSDLDAALAGIPHEYLTATDDFLQGGARARRELWPVILMLLMVVLVCEQALAWWFGTPRAASGAAGGAMGPLGTGQRANSKV